jgi:hypothetical protein
MAKQRKKKDTRPPGAGKLEDIDFSLALQDDPDPSLSLDNNNTLESRDNISRELGDIEVIEENNIDSGFDIKAQLNQQELRFMEIYLSGGITLINAMKSAGYIGYNDQSLYRLAKKIVEKYESQGGDHRKTMRALGFGEVKVIKLMIDAATNFKTEAVKVKAREILGKWLGLQQEELEGVEGITLVIRRPDPKKLPATDAEKTKTTALLPGPGTRMIK